jgi:hypothetical protein
MRAPLIQKIFELYSTGLYSEEQVAAKATKLGLATKQGRPLSPETFSRMLRNPFYAGELHVPAWWVRRAGNWRGLISRDTFDVVQALLSRKNPNATSHISHHPDFPLKRFVRCGRCNRRLTASWSKGRHRKYAYYRCQNKSCKAIHQRADHMHSLFVDFLGRLCPKPEFSPLFGQIIIDVWEHKHAEATALHEKAQQRLVTLRGRKQRLVEAYIYERAIDRDTYQEQIDKLNEEIALAEIDERDCRIQKLDVQAAVKFGEMLLLNAPRLWSEASPDQKRRLQHVFFARRGSIS